MARATPSVMASDRRRRGETVDRPDGPVAAGPVADGPVADGPVADGPAADGLAVRGTFRVRGWFLQADGLRRRRQTGTGPRPDRDGQASDRPGGPQSERRRTTTSGGRLRLPGRRRRRGRYTRP